MIADVLLALGHYAMKLRLICHNLNYPLNYNWQKLPVSLTILNIMTNTNRTVGKWGLSCKTLSVSFCYSQGQGHLILNTSLGFSSSVYQNFLEIPCDSIQTSSLLFRVNRAMFCFVVWLILWTCHHENCVQFECMSLIFRPVLCFSKFNILSQCMNHPLVDLISVNQFTHHPTEWMDQAHFVVLQIWGPY